MTTAATAEWIWADDKLFEDALVMIPDGEANRWETIAGLFGKSAVDVKLHYEILVHDVDQIEAGFVEIPSYPELTQSDRSSGLPPLPPTASKRKKGTPWSMDEHMLFLHGVNIYGWGDWRSISRMAVTSRKPSQVASHAQKYLNRQKSGSKGRKKRSSIHDTTLETLKSSIQDITLDCLPHADCNPPTLDCLTADVANAPMEWDIETYDYSTIL